MNNDSIQKWNLWSSSLWQESETGWIDRSPEDLYYKQMMVINPIVSIMHDRKFNSIVDLGGGDGYILDSISDQISPSDLPTRTYLIEQNKRQLEIARSKKHLRSTSFISLDLTAGDWTEALTGIEGPVLFIASFVLLELPTLTPILSNLSKLMKSEDELQAFIIDPAFSTKLLKEGKIELIGYKVNNNEDWEWAGKFPVVTENKVIWLPHFERSAEQYRAAAKAFALRMDEPVHLVLKKTPEALQVLGDSNYWHEILDVSSALQLTFRKI